MQKYEIKHFAFSFAFNKFRKSSVKRDMFVCAKNILTAELKDTKIKSTSGTLTAKTADFSFFLNTRNFFIMGATFEKEKDLEFINKVFNQVLEEFKGKNWGKELELTAIASLSAKVNKEINPILFFVNQTALKKIYQNDEDFSVKTLEIWQPPSDKLRKGFYIREEKFGTVLDCIRSNVYKSDMSKEIGLSVISELKKQTEMFFTQLPGEGCS